MIDNYQDIYSRYHDRPVLYKEHIPSNNGWNYTLIAKHLGLKYDANKLLRCYELSKVSQLEIKINRSPGKPIPLTSKDEIYAIFALLNKPPYLLLKNSHFNYNNNPSFHPKPLYKLNWFKVPFELWNLRKKHRNEVWQNAELYPNVIHLAFRLPPDYTYFIKQLSYDRKLTEDKPNFIHRAYFYIATYISLKSNRTSTKNIKWAMLKELKMEDSFLFDMIDIKTQIRDYFGDNHPFFIKVQSK